MLSTLEWTSLSPRFASLLASRVSRAVSSAWPATSATVAVIWFIAVASWLNWSRCETTAWLVSSAEEAMRIAASATEEADCTDSTKASCTAAILLLMRWATIPSSSLPSTGICAVRSPWATFFITSLMVSSG